VNHFTLRVIIILMETIKDLYQVATPTAAAPSRRRGERGMHRIQLGKIKTKTRRDFCRGFHFLYLFVSFFLGRNVGTDWKADLNNINA
jgi:hypothetical protein